MKIYIFILPVALLAAYSQIMVKLRTQNIIIDGNTNFLEKLYTYLLDPFIITAYASGLIASFAWLFVVTKLPLSIAFPSYIGLTFILVICGSWLFLAEPLNFSKLMAIVLIFSGIILGIWADG